MRLRLFEAVDRIAHVLYSPTTLGRIVAPARWHHRIHLIPDRLLGWVCNRFDLFLGVGPDELRRAKQDGFYEDDEPVADLLAAFDTAVERGKTARPDRPIRG